MKGAGRFGNVAMLAAAVVLGSVGCAQQVSATSSTAPTPRPMVSTPAPAPAPPSMPSKPAPKSAEEIVTSIVLTQSKQLGAPLDETEWKSLSSTICSNLTA